MFLLSHLFNYSSPFTYFFSHLFKYSFIYVSSCSNHFSIDCSAKLSPVFLMPNQFFFLAFSHFLALKNAPCSSHIVLTLILESSISPRSPGACGISKVVIVAGVFKANWTPDSQRMDTFARRFFYFLLSVRPHFPLFHQ